MLCGSEALSLSGLSFVESRHDSHSRKISASRDDASIQRMKGDPCVIHSSIGINGKRFVTVGALAQMFGVHKRTIQLWAKARKLRLIRVGNLMIFELDDL